MQTINENGISAPPKPGIPSIETRLLADHLGAVETEVIEYQVLSDVIGQSVQGKARRYLMAARQIVLREKGLVFRPVRNIGLKRLTQSEVAKLEDRFRHVRRTHKQTVRELKTVDIAALVDPQDRMACIGKMALAALTIHTHAEKQMKRIQAAVSPQARQLDMKETLELFANE